MANSREHIAWTWLARVSDALTLSTVLGSLIVAAGIAVWAYAKELPAPEVAVLGLLACFAVLGIVAALLYIAHAVGRKVPEGAMESAAPAPVAASSSTKSQLEVRFSSRAPYTYSDGRTSRYRIGVHNLGSTTVEHVRVELLSVAPPPKAGNFSADFPYPVRRVTDPEPKHYERVNADGKPLNPDAEDLFEVLSFWISSENRVIVDGLDTKPVQWDGKFEMHEHEAWCLRYRVSAGQGAPLTAVFLVRREENRVVMEQVSP
jgi:hypothetical protein